MLLKSQSQELPGGKALTKEERGNLTEGFILFFFSRPSNLLVYGDKSVPLF
jgi:hypothetical protein